MVDQNEVPIDKRFAALLKAILVAFAARAPSDTRPPLTHRPLVWLAWLALASWLGLGHLVTPDLRDAATRAARRPGRRGTSPEGQSSLFDFVVVTDDGLPGQFVSTYSLRTGNAFVKCGSYELWFAESTKANPVEYALSNGWGVIPALNGLRFLPPTVCALVLNDPPIVADMAKDTSPPRLLDMGADNPIRDVKPPGHHGSGDYGPDSFGGTDHGSHLHYEPPYAPGVISDENPMADAIVPCSHKDNHPSAKRCNACGEQLPPYNPQHIVEQTFRSKAHAQLVKNEEPGDRPAKQTTSTNPKRTEKNRDSAKKTTAKTTKKASKGKRS